jgi:hypothetical protein
MTTAIVETQPVLARPTFSCATKIFAQCEKEHLKAVRVLNGIANITNMSILIRRNIGGAIPDGFYNVGLGGALSPVHFIQNHKGYPDLEPFNPGAKATPLCVLKHEFILHLLGTVQQIRDLDGTVVIYKNVLYMKQDNKIGIEFEFNMPEPMCLSPYYLEAVLTEMLQYPEVQMLRVLDKVDGEIETPVLIGVSWDCCGLISPRRSWG